MCRGHSLVFASNSFIFLFLPVFLLVYGIVPAALRNLTILLFSWLFYAWWRLDFLPLIVGIAIWSYVTGFWIARAQGAERKQALFVGIIGPLLSLVWFKYANMLVGTGAALGFAMQGWQAIVLPIGLSFFVFGAISYSVDVYRQTVAYERSFINYATYQSMFGHLVAGPVVRYKWVADRLQARTFERAEFSLGVERFMLGFALKVLLADTLAPVVNTGYALEAPTTLDVIAAVVAYTMQLFFDFAGYSSMAIGLGLMVGLKFPENFDNPYLSTSLPEFWRRWHISLSSWLRDYLYIPLGGSRSGVAHTCINLLITMGLGGLWHGASWTFLVWGLWHGMGLVVVRLWQGITGISLPAVAGHVLTLVFVMFGWALFRALNWDEVSVIAHGVAGYNGVGFSDAFLAEVRPSQILAAVLGVLLIYSPLLKSLDPAVHTMRTALALPLWIVAVWVLGQRTVIPFLYFQF